jgi:phospholipase C
MDHASRRSFLKLLAAGAGSAAATRAFGALPAVIRRALSIPADRRDGTLMDVEHVLIFMQENRAFDHYFGTLRGVRGFGDPRPIMLPSGGDVFHQPWPGLRERYVLPYHLDSHVSRALCAASLDHGWKLSQTVWRNHDVWALLKTPRTMGYLTRADLPFYHVLADAFTVCDAYHSSLQGPTDPNRLFMFSGTCGLTVEDIDDGNQTAEMANDFAGYIGHAWTTTAERLQQQGVSWKVYQEYDNYGDNALAYFKAFRNLDRDSEAWRRARAIVPGSNGNNSSSSNGQFLVDALARDVQNGTLPQVAWIVAPRAQSEHPDYSPAQGESLSARLLTALVAEPSVWARTVFLINYDENDGLFDHMPIAVPPLTPALGESTASMENESWHGVPIGLGARVPMLMISPWSKGGWVCSEQFDHTSVLRFLERRFGIAESNISPWRRAVCGDLTSAFDFARADTNWPVLPDPADYLEQAIASCALPLPQRPTQQQMPRQEPGLRPARALPYRLQVGGRVNVARGSFELDLCNEGPVGLSLIVYSRLRSDGPWHYTLEGGRRIAAEWRSAPGPGRYQFAVHGPNGFLREFAGEQPGAGAPSPEVYVEHDDDGRLLRLVLVNAGGAPCRLSVAPVHYSREAARTISLSAGGHATLEYDLTQSLLWYDLKIVADGDAHYLRRLAGHVETGRPGWSDPAFATQA